MLHHLPVRTKPVLELNKTYSEEGPITIPSTHGDQVESVDTGNPPPASQLEDALGSL